jgi:hypothetical protein
MFIMEAIQDYINENLLSFLIFKDNAYNITSVKKFNWEIMPKTIYKKFNFQF